VECFSNRRPQREGFGARKRGVYQLPIKEYRKKKREGTSEPKKKEMVTASASMGELPRTEKERGRKKRQFRGA